MKCYAFMLCFYFQLYNFGVFLMNSPCHYEISTNAQGTSYINQYNTIKLFHRPVIFPSKTNTAKKQTFNKGMNDVLENN